MQYFIHVPFGTFVGHLLSDITWPVFTLCGEEVKMSKFLRILLAGAVLSMTAAYSPSGPSNRPIGPSKPRLASPAA